MKALPPIVLVDASIQLFDCGHSGIGTIERNKNGEKRKKERNNGICPCLPYCMFEEGTPGRLALSNQAH